MGFLRWLGLGVGSESAAGDKPAVRMASQPAAAKFGVDVPQELLEAMTVGGSLARRVTREEALQVPAVMRVRNLIAGTLCTLPMRFHDQEGRIARPTSLLEQIDPDVPNSVTMAQTFEDLLFEGISWWRVIDFGWHGFPVQAQHVPIGSVHVAGTGQLPSEMRISPDIPFPADGQVFIDGMPVSDREVFRFDSPNPPLLLHAARAIRTALRLDRTASQYAEEPMPQGVFTELENNQDILDEDEINKLLNDWSQARRTRTWAYMGGLRAETLQWSPEQLQLADARQHAVLEIARAAGIDAEDLGVSTTSRTYANAESRRLALLDFTLAAYVRAVEQRLSMRDVLPRGYTTQFQFDGFLRSDTLTRMRSYEIGLRVGAITREEIRELEGRPPLTPEQEAEIQQRQQPEQPETDTSDAPDIDSQQAQEATVPTAMFETETERITFSDPEIASTFRVNPEKRTISGLVVPWGKIANNGQARWRFAENSLHWVDETRTKLNLHHDSTQAIAYAMRLQPTSAGLDATFKVARGSEGDRALSFAEDKVLDGFSAEIDFADGDGWEPDPADKSVRLVKRAKLRGVALTAVPAFDDARVSAVAASRDTNRKDMTMATETVDTQDGAPDEKFDFAGYMKGLGDQITESHKNLTEGLAESLGESISAGFKTALENLPSPQDGPQPVRAARYTVTREEPVYSFNGMGHSLVRDAWYAGREGDDDAIDRLRKYRKQQEEMAKLAQQFTATAHFVPQSTTSASEIIPPGYRPDLYVPELNQGRPLISGASRGTISNATPFLVPVFGSSTGATADHTEGTNPSDGSLTFNELTVSPGAKSGRLTLTREIVDSSNPAIDTIALQTMRESYNQQTEAEAYEALNTATGVQHANGAADLDLSDGTLSIAATRAALADYPFVRFAAPNTMYLSRQAVAGFATAEGTDGRPLLPSVGAQNTSGVGNAVTQGWFVDGLPAVPAWAMTTAIGDAGILGWNRMDVWVWESALLTFRFEEKQGPANIELNVFGYFAVHVLRPSGVFKLTTSVAG